VVELDDGKNLHTFVAECAGDNEITIPQSNKAEKSKRKLKSTSLEKQIILKNPLKFPSQKK
jgi:hypothetical protein